MELRNASNLRSGDRVTFTGGTGRNDVDAIYTGIVNGEPYMNDGGVCYVPVHITALNHNVAVAHTNVIGLVVGA